MYEQHMNINFIKLLKYGSRNGDLDIMQKILNNISLKFFSLLFFEDIFQNACSNGHLNVAQWLYQIKSDINISARNESAFINACSQGHLNVAQWLYQI